MAEPRDLQTPVAQLAAELIAIDSTNSDLVPGAAGETEIAAYCTTWLEGRGFECVTVEATNPGHPSVLAFGGGARERTPVMFNGHLDAVTLASYEGDGLDPRCDDGKLYGRGSYDMKGGCAAMMVAAEHLAAAGHPVVLALVADEEWGSLGTEAVLEWYASHPDTPLPRFGVVCEPTDLELVPAHRGWASVEIVFHGVAAHGSRPEQGVDAIAKAGKFLGRLEQLHTQLTQQPAHPMLGTGGLHASIISGGQEVSSYPDRCTVILERRTLPGEDGASTVAELTAVLDDIAASDPDFRYDISCTFERAALEQPEHLPQLQPIVDAYRQHTGGELTIRGEQFWTDAALMAQAGIPTVLFGPAGAGPHAKTEYVDIASLDTLTAILYDVASAPSDGSAAERHQGQ